MSGSDSARGEVVVDASRFEQRVAVITGGARGLGLAMAKGMAVEGATVVLLDADRQAVDDAAHRLTASGLVGDGCSL